MKKYLAFDIGCIGCGEESRPLKVCETKKEANKVCSKYRYYQKNHWRGQHNFVVYELLFP
jgi:hypothetical protein